MPEVPEAPEDYNEAPDDDVSDYDKAPEEEQPEEPENVVKIKKKMQRRFCP